MNPVAAKPEIESFTPRKTELLLLEIADAVNVSLDLGTLFQRIAELVRKVVDYEIFAILLVNEKTQEMRMRFQIGHSPEAEKLRIPIGRGITGMAAQRREPVLVGDVAQERNYINAHPDVRSELAVPLIVKNKVIGVVDIQSTHLNYFNEEHVRLLTLVGSRVAAGIENARLYTRVARQAKTLAILNEISRDLTSILHLDELLKRVGDLISRLIDYQMFSILLLDPTGSKLQHRFSMRFRETVQLKHDIPVGEGLVGYAVKHREPVLVADVSQDPRYINLNPETRSELCVPLLYKDRAIGVLDLEHTRRGYFTEEHMRTITTLAAQLAIAIENARLYERVMREEKRLERDLALARELQFQLLPPCCPVMANAQLAAKFAPAYAIGGDLYDFIGYTGSRVAINIGDVSGKGAAAALYAGLVNGIVRSTAASEPGPAEMLSAVNLSLIERPISGQFVSLIYAIWDDEERALYVANSGLPRPIHCRAEGDSHRVEVVEAIGLPLGLFPDAEHDELRLEPQPGDVFVFMSDGILDASNAQGELFGRRRVEQVVAENCSRTADEIVEAIFSAVARHVDGVQPFDDQTVVALKIGSTA